MEVLAYLICIAVANFALLAQPTFAQGVNTLHLTYHAQVLQGDGSQTCPSEEQRERVRNEVKNATQRLLRESVLACGGLDWRRVAYLNMSDTSQQSPSVWQEITTPHRVCGRRSTTGNCEGVTYPTGSDQYDQVCGRIIGYQIGTPDGFNTGTSSIDSYYVDGISLTHGYPRQHIWTFANGLDEGSVYHSSTCPCVTGNSIGSLTPSFVGQNYFCESGLTQWSGGGQGYFWPNGDPLWDGQGCGPTSSCCTFNSPPWFNVTLSSPTTDYIEVRICSNHGSGFENFPIELLELYVK